MCTIMLSDKEFLKSVQGKLINNKRKAEPDMRVEALLASTCKRLRREIKLRNVNYKSVQSGELVTDSASPKSNNNQYSNVADYGMNWFDNNFGLLDDPKQVELFLRQVEGQSETNIVNERSLETNDNLNTLFEILDKSGFYANSLTSGCNDFDVLCTNFDSLYGELLDSLASVEKWMCLAANENVRIDLSSGYLTADQNESSIDLSSLFEVAKEA